MEFTANQNMSQAKATLLKSTRFCAPATIYYWVDTTRDADGFAMGLEVLDIDTPLILSEEEWTKIEDEMIELWNSGKLQDEDNEDKRWEIKI